MSVHLSMEARSRVIDSSFEHVRTRAAARSVLVRDFPSVPGKSRSRSGIQQVRKSPVDGLSGPVPAKARTGFGTAYPGKRDRRSRRRALALKLTFSP